MKTIKDLKEMMSEPASKEWFAKHGLPKSHAKSKALERKKHPKIREIENSHEGRKDSEREKRMNKMFGTFEERVKKFKK